MKATVTVDGWTATVEGGKWTGKPPALVEDARQASKMPMPDEHSGQYIPDEDWLLARRVAHWLGGTVSGPEPREEKGLPKVY